jgi:DNA topoisomerase IB
MRAAEVLNSSEAYTRVIVDRSQADPDKKDWISLRTITQESVETFKITKEEVLNAVKTYKRKEESLEVYLSRLKDMLENETL